MRSAAPTVEQYLASLPADRREAIAAVRATILENLDGDVEEGILGGMICYYVPHRVFPAGYHCDPEQPLAFAGLASQKNYMALYLMSVYVGSADLDGAAERHARWFREAWAQAGKRLDMGKCCIRFRKLADLPLEVIGEAIRRVPARAFIAHYEAGRQAAAEAAALRKSAGGPGPRSRRAPRKTTV